MVSLIQRRIGFLRSFSLLLILCETQSLLAQSASRLDSASQDLWSRGRVRCNEYFAAGELDQSIDCFVNNIFSRLSCSSPTCDWDRIQVSSRGQTISVNLAEDVLNILKKFPPDLIWRSFKPEGIFASIGNFNEDKDTRSAAERTATLFPLSPNGIIARRMLFHLDRGMGRYAQATLHAQRLLDLSKAFRKFRQLILGDDLIGELALVASAVGRSDLVEVAKHFAVELNFKGLKSGEIFLDSDSLFAVAERHTSRPGVRPPVEGGKFEKVLSSQLFDIERYGAFPMAFLSSEKGDTYFENPITGKLLQWLPPEGTFSDNPIRKTISRIDGGIFLLAGHTHTTETYEYKINKDTGELSAQLVYSAPPGYVVVNVYSSLNGNKLFRLGKLGAESLDPRKQVPDLIWLDSNNRFVQGLSLSTVKLVHGETPHELSEISRELNKAGNPYDYANHYYFRIEHVFRNGTIVLKSTLNEITHMFINNKGEVLRVVKNILLPKPEHSNYVSARSLLTPEQHQVAMAEHAKAPEINYLDELVLFDGIDLVTYNGDAEEISRFKDPRVKLAELDGEVLKNRFSEKNSPEIAATLVDWHQSLEQILQTHGIAAIGRDGRIALVNPLAKKLYYFKSKSDLSPRVFDNLSDANAISVDFMKGIFYSSCTLGFVIRSLEGNNNSERCFDQVNGVTVKKRLPESYGATGSLERAEVVDHTFSKTLPRGEGWKKLTYFDETGTPVFIDYLKEPEFIAFDSNGSRLPELVTNQFIDKAWRGGVLDSAKFDTNLVVPSPYSLQRMRIFWFDAKKRSESNPWGRFYSHVVIHENFIAAIDPEESALFVYSLGGKLLSKIDIGEKELDAIGRSSQLEVYLREIGSRHLAMVFTPYLTDRLALFFKRPSLALNEAAYEMPKLR